MDSNSNSPILQPETKVLEKNPLFDRYDQNIGVSKMFMRERIANPLIPDDPFILPPDSNIPSDYELVPADIPFPGQPGFREASLNLMAMQSSGYSLIYWDDVVTDPQDPRKATHIFVPQGRNHDGKLAIGSSFMMITTKDHIAKMRLAQKMKNRAVFEGQLEARGQKIDDVLEENSKMKGEDLGFVVQNSREDFKQTTGSLSVEDLMGLQKRVGKGEGLESALGLNPNKA